MLTAEMFARLEVMSVDMRSLAADKVIAESTFTKLPFEEAISFFKSKNILSSREFNKLSDAYKRKSFTVAGDFKKYTLDKMKSHIDDAITEGKSKGRFMKELNEYFDNAGITRLKKHHLECVFDTNVLGSYAHGRFEQLSEPAVLKARPYWQYKTIGDHRVRLSHREMDGKIYPTDSEVWNTWFPPNGFRCRCSVISLSKSEADKKGLSEPLPIGLVPDEGFATSPKDFLE